MEKICLEYIWLDGQKPTPQLRSKTKVMDYDDKFKKSRVSQLIWTFDGSSTYQAEGHASDLILMPVRAFKDPLRGEPHRLLLCEVLNPDYAPHWSNTRAILREVAEKYKKHQPLVGIEQEYTLYNAKSDRPLGWPKSNKAFPAPQGPYYCGVGSDKAYGRQLVEDHLTACINIGLKISGINAEVMPGQWEFQVGPLEPLEAADQLWMGRWLLYRLGENYGISVKLDPKPVAGDWNGAGAHTNFSTREIREAGCDAKSLEEVMKKVIEKLERNHKEHIQVYGADNDKRLTGKHETCDINTFRWGYSDRGASVRIPLLALGSKNAYFEDRRPAANMDPYKVCTALLETVCGEGFKIPNENWVDLKI